MYVHHKQKRVDVLGTVEMRKNSPDRKRVFLPGAKTVQIHFLTIKKSQVPEPGSVGLIPSAEGEKVCLMLF